MSAWELVAVLGSLFFLGMARGATVCLSVCVPGLLPYLAERPRSAREGAAFGALLCVPRLLIFAGIGVVWGAVSYQVFQSSAFEGAATWLHVLGYMVLGVVITVLGLGLFLKAAREKEDLRQERLRRAEGDGDGGKGSPRAPTDACEEPRAARRHRVASALSSLLLRFIPGTDRSERAFVLLWGSILGFACLLEVSILELGILGAAASGTASGTAVAAGLGAVAMLLFALGASVPIVVASAAFAAYVDRVTAREKLVSIRITGSLVMVMIGSLLFLRYLVYALSL